MTSDKVQKLIARMRRTKINGRGFDRILSEAAKLVLIGELTLKDGELVRKPSKSGAAKL